MNFDIVTFIIGLAVGAVVFGAICFVLGRVLLKKSSDKTIGDAKTQAANILNNAMAEAETKRKETLIEAKDEIQKLRSDADKEIRDRRSEVQRSERRLVQKEEHLDKKVEMMEKKEEMLQNRIFSLPVPIL